MITKLLTLKEIEEMVKGQRDEIRREIKVILEHLILKLVNGVDLLTTSEGRLQYQRIQSEIYECYLSSDLSDKYDKSESVGEWSADDWKALPCKGEYPLGTLLEDGNFTQMYQSGIYNRKYALVNKETGNIFEVNVSHIFEDPTIEYMGFSMHVNCLFLTHCCVSVTYYRERKLTETKYCDGINLYDKVKNTLKTNMLGWRLQEKELVFWNH